MSAAKPPQISPSLQKQSSLSPDGEQPQSPQTHSTDPNSQKTTKSNSSSTVQQPVEQHVHNLSQHSSVDNEMHTENTPDKLPKTETDQLKVDDIKAAIIRIDENLDDALVQAADTFWNFATSVRGTVSSVVGDQAGLETLRRNVTTSLAPLDHIGRDIQSHIDAFAPKEVSIANITGSMRNVAETVQRNAQAVEKAILARANEPVSQTQPTQLTGEQNMEAFSVLAGADAGMDILSTLPSERGESVNDDLTNVGEKVSEKVGGISHAIGETVGNFFTGLWGNDEYYDEIARRVEANVPSTRFEKRVFELQGNPETYCDSPKDMDAFKEWGKNFLLDDYAESCIEILYTHETIADLYERTVPNVIEESLFWMRCFYAKHVLEREEERRKKLLEQASTTEIQEKEHDDWGDDDWGDDINQSNEESDIQGSTSRVTSGATSNTNQEEQISATGNVAAKATDSLGAKKQDKSPGAGKVSQAGIENTQKKDGAVVDDDWGDDDWE